MGSTEQLHRAGFLGAEFTWLYSSLIQTSLTLFINNNALSLINMCFLNDAMLAI